MRLKTRKVAKGDKQPRFAARRASLGKIIRVIPSLKATNNLTVNVARLQRAEIYLDLYPAMLAGRRSGAVCHLR